MNAEFSPAFISGVPGGEDQAAQRLMHCPRYWNDRSTPGRKDTALPGTRKGRESCRKAGNQKSTTATAEKIDRLREVTGHMRRREAKPILDQVYQHSRVAFVDQ
jgi:hypothetical protein